MFLYVGYTLVCIDLAAWWVTHGNPQAQNIWLGHDDLKAVKHWGKMLLMWELIAGIYFCEKFVWLFYSSCPSPSTWKLLMVRALCHISI